jgi:hypothetical protein
MKKDLFKYLKTIPSFDYPDTKPDFKEEHEEKELGFSLPEDYKDVMKNCYCCEFHGENNHMNIMCTNDVFDLNTDPLWMVPLRGLFLFGGDNGGNFFAYDPTNKLGRGAFAVYFIDHDNLGLNSAKYAGENLTSTVEKILHDEKGIWEWPTMEEEGFPQAENKPVPKVTVGSMEELLKAIPSNINSEKYGEGILEIKEDKGLISGSYHLPKTDMVLFYTFSRSYQGFYDAIAPALTMDGLI